jgi:flagellar basal-body rod protein FlgB
MELFGSLDFKAMESSFKSLAIQQQVITQNLANQDTPDYKQQEVSFANVLAEKTANGSVDVKTAKGQEYDFQTNIYTDTDRNILIDGNSVDTDQQQLLLYQTYLQHAALSQKITGTFTRLQTVAKAQM